MKKFIAILLVVALTITSVFAVDMSIGAEFGYGQISTKIKDGDMKLNEMIVPVRADFLLGLDDLPLAFRFNLGTNIDKVTGQVIGGHKHDIGEMNSVPSISASASVYYKYEATEDLTVLAGLGLGYDRVNVLKLMGASDADVKEAKENSVSYMRNALSLYIDAQVRYEVVDHVELFGGVTLGGNVMDKITLKAPGIKETGKFPALPEPGVTMDFDVSNFRWGVNVGAAYKF